MATSGLCPLSPRLDPVKHCSHSPHQLLESHLALYLDLGSGGRSMCVYKIIIKHTCMIWAFHSMLVIGSKKL